MIKKTTEYIRLPKRVFYPVVALILVAGLYYIFRPRLAEVELAPIKRDVFQQAVVDEGYTHFKEKHVLSAPTDGIVPTHDWRPGDPVKKNQVLLQYIWDRRLPIKSPVDGYVLNVFEKDRRRLAAGTPILEVGAPEQVEVVANLLSSEVVKIKVGDEAVIKNWGGESPLSAKVAKIEKSAEEVVSALGVKEQRVNVHFDITTERDVWKNLGDGFQVEVEVITDKIPQALLLPTGALFVKNGKAAVFRYDEASTQVYITNVDIGGRSREFVHVLAGLTEGQRVVLYPSDDLRDGQKIKIKDKQ